MSLETHPQWTVYSASQNLPAVLNDPNRGKQSSFFTKTWGDSFVETSDVGKSPFLPVVTIDQFENYFKRYGKKHRRHVRFSQTKTDASKLKGQGESCDNQLLANNCIPQIFLQTHFPLNDPVVFNALFKGKGVHLLENGRVLQEQYSHYLDYVEEQIALQVSHRSGAFFHAMTSHDTIMEQMGSACRQVRSLRSKIHTIDKMLAKDSLKLLGLQRCRANQFKLLYTLKLMATVLQTQPTIQLLLSASDYVAALELIGSTQEVLARELAGVTSLRHLPSQLKEMSRLIDKMLSSEFERYAAADLHRPLNVSLDLVEPQRLSSLIAGLFRQNNFKFLDVYKQEAIIASQTILKQLLIEQLVAVEDDVEHCLTGSGEVPPPPSFDSEQWLKVLSLASSALIHLIRRVKAVHDVVRQTADAFFAPQQPLGMVEEDDRPLPLNQVEYKRLQSKLDDLLNYICEYSNERLATLINTQTNKQAITASEIMQLSNIVENFCHVCETVCGSDRSNHKLRAEFKIQASNYVYEFHCQRKHNLALLLDAEGWKAAQVPHEFQVLIDKFACSKPIPMPALNNNNNHSCAQQQVETTRTKRSAAAAASCLRVGSEDYVAVGTVLILIRLVSEYCVCARDLPLLAPTIGRNLSELLRTFNSKSFQLVLQAGALRPSELETITSTNLALTSRALQLVLWLIPHIRAHFGTFSSDPLASLDVVQRDIHDHIGKLQTKIVHIMNDCLGKQLRDWEAKPPIPSRTFRNISMHITKLYKAIGPVLPKEQVTDVYEVVHKHFKSKLREYVLRMSIQNNGGPQHGVVTSEILFYLETLKNLKILPDKYFSENAMDDIWMR